MENSHPFRWTSIGLALINTLSAMALLLFSAWFIVACALAGAPGVVAGFNYVVPAAVIRFLALLRISSGYADKYTGHLHLLAQLRHIRTVLLNNIFNGKRSVGAFESAQSIQQETEKWAARWTAIMSPAISTLSLFFVLSFAFFWFWSSLVFVWIFFTIVVIALTAYFSFAYIKTVKLELKKQRLFLFIQRQWLHRATLWPLVNDKSELFAVNKAANLAAAERHRGHAIVNMIEHALVALALLMTSLLSLGLQATSSTMALWIIPFFVLMTVQDWLMPLFGSVQQAIQLRAFRHSQVFGDCSDGNSERLEPEPFLPMQIKTISLENFQWQREEQVGKFLNASMSDHGLYFINSPSGIGKSSLFYALSGELSYQGSAFINEQALNEINPGRLRRTVHHMEQFGHIFSGTLAANLRVANPKASDQQLLDALKWAELHQWTTPESLRVWLGAEGLPISGGEEKRILLARVYLTDANILLLDEPFEALDASTIASLGPKIQALSKHKCIVVASHIQPDSLEIQETLSFL